MKKKVVIITLSVLIVIGLVICTLLIIKKLDENKKAKKEIETKIVENYQIFRAKVEDFNEERKIYSNAVASDLFKESAYKYEEWIKEIDKYTTAIKEVEKVSSYLKDNCVNKLYSKQDIKNKCDAFVIAYETAFNYYVKDMISFNESIEEFNKELKEKYEKIELEYEYVDINKDGKFYGKD